MVDVPIQPSALALVRRGPFARLWWAGVIGSTGDWITIFATFAVAESIAGGTGIFMALAARILPGLVFGAAAGVIADRVDRRKLIIFSDVGRGVVVPFMAFVETIPMLVFVSLALEFLGLLGQSPRAAVVPDLVDERALVNANSLIMGASYGTIPVGAAVGWILGSLPALSLGGLVPVGNAEIAVAFFADSATFFLSGAIVALLPRLEAKLDTERQGDGVFDLRASFRDLAAGAAFMWRTRTVRRVIVGMAAALFGGGTVIILGIPFVEDVLGADVRGFFAVVAALGFGVATGIVLVSLYAARILRRDVAFAAALITTGVGLTASALTSTVAGAAAWLLVMGIGAGSAYVMGFTHLHESVDEELRGRVFAALFTLMRIGLFVSMTIAVPVAAVIGGRFPAPLDQPTRDVLALGGLVVIASGAMTLWSLRRVFQRPKLGPEARRIFEEAARVTARRTHPTGPRSQLEIPGQVGEGDEVERGGGDGG